MASPSSRAPSDGGYDVVPSRNGSKSSMERVSMDSISLVEAGPPTTSQPLTDELGAHHTAREGSRRSSLSEKASNRTPESLRKRSSSANRSLIDKSSAIKNWPVGPQALGRIQYHLFTGDAILFLLPVLFFILAIAAYKLDGKPLSDYGKTVQQASQLGPTIFPLVFAALGGRCLKSLAVRLAERGTTIQSLEKLLGSRNVVGAIGTAVSLRSFDSLSVALLCLWALSPLGGQSSLRLLNTVNSTITEPGTIGYADHQAPFVLEPNVTWGSVVPGVLSASVMASDALSNRSTDLWNHMRVPRLDAIETQDITQLSDQGPWITVNHTANLNYSSWTGVNVQGLRSNGRSNFTIKHSYLYLNCSFLRSIDSETELKNEQFDLYPAFEQNPLRATGNSSKTADPFSLCYKPELETQKYSFLMRNIRNISKLTDQQLYNSSDRAAYIERNSSRPITLLYGTQVDLHPCTHLFECKVNIAVVDAQILCKSDNCIVDRMRRIPDTLHRNKENTRCNVLFNKLSCLQTSTMLLDNFINLFANTTTTPPSIFRNASRPGNPFDDYIFGRTTSFGRNPFAYTNRNSTDPETVAHRLTTLLNTYWQAGSWGTQIIKAQPYITPGRLSENYAGPPQPEYMTNETVATFSRDVPVYKASIPWIIILTLTTTVLAVLGGLNLLILYSTAAPDVFEYSSSLTRENPYIDLPPGGTGLSGMDRSRLLRDVQVQLVDVRPGDEVGYVVLKSVVRKEGYSEGRLRLGRLYE